MGNAFFFARVIIISTMVRPNKRKRQLKQLSRNSRAVQMRIRRAKERWEARLEDFEGYCEWVKNPNGKRRTFEENKMICLALKAGLRRRVRDFERGLDPRSISWTSIDQEIAADFGFNLADVVAIRKQFIESEGADVIVNKDDDRKGGVRNNNNQQKVTERHLLAIVEYVDSSHAKGQSVTVRKVMNHLSNVHDLSISRTQVRYSMKKLGLKYLPVKARRRNNNSFRPERIREFVIGYDEVYRKIQNGEKWKFVFADESYVHQNHQTGHSYFVNGKTTEMNRSASKGRRLIILHAITVDGPLADTDPVTNKPAVGQLKWSGQTPYPELRDDKLLTTETIWPADTHTGDYHDNMRSDIFLKWVDERLIPTFKQKYP